MATLTSRPSPAGAGDSGAAGKFTLDDGRRVGVTFALVTSLFLL